MNYDERQKFEHELIDRKLRWLLTSQTILFAALALVFNKGASNVPPPDDDKAFLTLFLCVLGGLTSALTGIGIISAAIGKWRNYKDERKKQEGNRPLEFKHNPVQWGVKTRFTWWATCSDCAMPIVFFLGWIVILVYLT